MLIRYQSIVSVSTIRPPVPSRVKCNIVIYESSLNKELEMYWVFDLLRMDINLDLTICSYSLICQDLKLRSDI